MAPRTQTKKTADTCRHLVTGTCWRCCEADMRDHLAANGIDPAKYFDGRNGEGTPEPRTRTGGNRDTSTRPAETATDAQIWRIRHERDRRDTSRVQLPADADLPAMSKRAASDLIDKLTDGTLCPVVGPSRRRATPGQRSYVTDLLAERVYADPVDVDTLTFDQASALIDTLRAAPRLVDASPLPDGMYRRDGVMYRVRTDKNGRKLCHRGRLVTAEVRGDDGAIITPAVLKFRSDPAALGRLTEADLMTAGEVTEFGVSYGICVFGHPLSDPVSVAAGIGPKCAANVGIDQMEAAIANGYVPPVTAARKTRARRAPVAEAAPVAEVFVSPWSLV